MPPSQSGNIILESMAAADREALAPHLSELAIQRGATLIRQGERVTTVHFPVSADLSNSLTLSDGRTIETTSVGRDGVSSLSAFLADAAVPCEVVCLIPGLVVAVEAEVLRRQAKASPALADLLLRSCHESHSQAVQTAACNALHDVTQRLARWLLMVADRTGATRMEMTQENVAAQLGAQRTTINAAAQTLRGRGAISFTRGQLRIDDRSALEAVACECYAAHLERRAALGLAAAYRSCDPVTR